ncbi:MAG: tetratricopeptide repeat protein [Chitinophagaceae bacterium]|nr:tetratricopeptide repeat protein [Chitinophagaceae bacterium]
MKNILGLLLLMHICCSIQAQIVPDSVLVKYSADSNKLKKGRILSKYFNFDFEGTEDEKLAMLLKTKLYFESKKEPVGADYCEAFVVSYAWSKGDYAIALEKGLNILPNFESRKDTFGIIQVTNSLAIASSDSKNYTQAIEYLKRTLQYSTSSHERVGVITSLNNMADIYNKLKQKDTALYYIQQAYLRSREYDRPYHNSLVLTTMGETYILRGEYEIAKPFIARAVYYGFQTDDSSTVSYNYSSMANCFFEQQQYDSSLYYASTALHYATPFYKAEMLKAAEWMYKNYEKKHNTDSVHFYYVMATELKDSLYSLDKIKNIQQLNFHEQMREQEKLQSKIEQDHRRIKNLQLTGIAIFIITFISFIIIFKVKRNNSASLEFLGIMGVLLLFEFLSMLLHPFLERTTNHNPFLMLMSLVSLGAVIAPLHHNMTAWMKKKEARDQISAAQKKKPKH